MKPIHALTVVLFSFLIAVVPSSTIFAQNLLMQDELGDALDQPNMMQDPVKLSAWLRVKEGSREGILSVKATIAENWHLYSITQPKGGPLPTRINLPESSQYELTGDFEPDADPEIGNEEGIRTEYHHDQVIWSAPIKFADGVDAPTLKMELRFRGQTCVKNGGCIPLSEKVQVTFDGFIAAPVADAKFKPGISHLLLSGNLRRVEGPGEIQPGDRLALNLTAEPTDGFHVYPFAPTKEDDLAWTPTLIEFTKKNDWTINGPSTVGDSITKTEYGVVLEYHEDPVTWKYILVVPEDAKKKSFVFSGLMGFQTCTEQCDPPDAVKFSVEVNVGSEINAVPVTFVAEGSYDEIVERVNRPDPSVEEGAAPPPLPKQEIVAEQDTPEQIAEMAQLYDAEEKVNYLLLSELDANPVGQVATIRRGSRTTLWTALFGAFFGGMLLNLMPCVFPVLGIKVMGFVEQAGEKASKIRMHGLSFAAGLVVSMWILAGIILTLKLVFGQSVN